MFSLSAELPARWFEQKYFVYWYDFSYEQPQKNYDVVLTSDTGKQFIEVRF